MKVSVTGRHVEITQELTTLLTRKLEKIERVLNDSVVSAQVVLSQQNHACRVELTLHARGDHVMHGEGEASAWAQAIGAAVDKVDHQAHTLKGKWETRRRRAEATPDDRV